MCEGRHAICWGRRGLVVMAAGWLSLDRQFEPYLRANTVAPSWCGLGCRSRTLMVEYISPLFCAPCNEKDIVSLVSVGGTDRNFTEQYFRLGKTLRASLWCPKTQKLKASFWYLKLQKLRASFGYPKPQKLRASFDAPGLKSTEQFLLYISEQCRC